MTREHGPLHQLRLALRHPSALLMGAALGGFVPLATFMIAHMGGLVVNSGGDVSFATWTNPCWILVLGGLLFSATTVWTWGYSAFAHRLKALGYVVLVEGVLVLSPFLWLSVIALAYLMAINALATGCQLALRDLADGAERIESAALTPEAESVEPYTAGALLQLESEASPALPAEAAGSAGDAYAAAVAHVSATGYCTISDLQRTLRIGYNRAAKIVSRMVREGLVGEPDKSGRRAVLLLAAG